MRHKVLVYGTLRPGAGTTRLVPGTMYDLGAYPGIKLGSPKEKRFVVVEEIEVDDDGLRRLDQYEGYSRYNPKGSLYIRMKAPCGSWIYQFNDEIDKYAVVESGDWLDYTDSVRGSAAGLGSNAKGRIYGA